MGRISEKARRLWKENSDREDWINTGEVKNTLRKLEGRRGKTQTVREVEIRRN